MLSKPVPWWAVLSSACAPVLLIGGWHLAQTRQQGDFNPVSQTISALADRNAADPWIMTTALLGVGVCHMTTAVGLAPAATAGRLLLGTGGVATVVLAVCPLSASGESPMHMAAAAVAFTTLSLWPALAEWRWGKPECGVSLIAASGLLGLLGWFGTEYFSESLRIGLSERILAGAQAFWPLAAVLLAHRSKAVGSGVSGGSGISGYRALRAEQAARVKGTGETTHDYLEYGRPG